MAAQSETPRTPPQYSADRRWWWDGSQWVPVTDASVSQGESTTPTPMLGSNETLLSVLSHISIFGLPVVGPLIIMLTEGKSSTYIRHHSAAALNFQLTFGVVYVVWYGLPALISPSTPFLLPTLLAPASLLAQSVLISLAACLVLAVPVIVLPIRAAIRADCGELYRYPFTVRVVRPTLPPIEFERPKLPRAQDGHRYWNGQQWVSVPLPIVKWARPYSASDVAATAAMIMLGAAVIAEGWIMLADCLWLTRSFLPNGSAMAWRIVEVASVFDLALFPMLLIYLGAALTVMAWMYCAYGNLPVLGAQKLRWSPAWAVGGWFIPVANLFIPYQVLRDIWKSADERSYLPLYWWIVWIIGSALAGAALLFHWSQPVGLVVDVLRDFLPAVAGVLLIVIIQRVTRRQRVRYAQLTGV